MSARVALTAFGLGLLSLAANDAGDEDILTEREREIALELSPLPPVPPDPTNAVYENELAARFGHALFFDERLSGPGDIACATCHEPARSWTDGLARAKAVGKGPFHTMSLWNVAYNRWFFWDGRKDSLWSQALGPFEDEREHGASRLQIAHIIAGDDDYRAAFAALFGPLPDISDRSRFPLEGRPVPDQPDHEHARAWASMSSQDKRTIDDIFVGVGKSIAAFERLIVSRRAPFDVFVEGLRTGDDEKLRAISPAAQRGFSIFVGKGNCVVCHDGPNFTDLEFHTNRFPTAEGADLGRPRGVRTLLNDPFNSRSRHADDGGAVGKRKLKIVPVHAHLPGLFKTPSLRNVEFTAPYMHEGQAKSLEAVVEFYSTLRGAAAVPPGVERIIQPLNLTEQEQADLVVFLKSLSDETISEELLRAPSSPIRSAAK